MTPSENTGESTHESDESAASDSSLLAKVLTVSDGVAEGVREDRSGEALVATLISHNYDVVEHSVVADGVESVAERLSELTSGFSGLVVTTGGTGFTERDLTTEGTRRVIEREAPGIAEAMRLTNPLGRLSRGVAGIVGGSIVINTPGSTAGCVECFEAVADVLPHALRLLHGERLH
ncbi:MAG: MogA/MoaB family molybdenum cofactor biosynthesis protein [Actinomycetota bacterium]|nr:MogA/MoaB family molybdenum cofactor biosynthesis protein [Actinomycetota bacterium]